LKRASLLVAASVVLIANAFALLHAWRNRSGPVESDITLTERELFSFYDATSDDSGVTVNLHWTDPQQGYMPDDPVRWLDRKTLQELGFDTSVAPSDTAASEFYQRQRARRAFVALEYDGPAWHKWIDAVEHRVQGQSPLPAYGGFANQRETSPRLVAIDAGSDAARLRARHPDRISTAIVRAVIHIGVTPEGANRPAQVYGMIAEIPSSIHVPLPFSDALRPVRGNRTGARYRIHLRYGSSLEPWIVGVEVLARAAR
jgi:hypothetical protein